MELPHCLYAAAKQHKLSRGAALMLGYLWSRTKINDAPKWAYPRISTIAELGSVSDRQADRWRKELERSGLIVRARGPSKAGKRVAGWTLRVACAPDIMVSGWRCQVPTCPHGVRSRSDAMVSGSRRGLRKEPLAEPLAEPQGGHSVPPTPLVSQADRARKQWREETDRYRKRLAEDIGVSLPKFASKDLDSHIEAARKACDDNPKTIAAVMHHAATRVQRHTLGYDDGLEAKRWVFLWEDFDVHLQAWQLEHEDDDRAAKSAATIEHIRQTIAGER